CRGPHRIHIVEEKRDRDIQYPAEVMQPTGADTISASLILLDLLEGQPYGLTELFLTNPKHIPAKPDSRPDMDVDRVRLVAFPAARTSGRLLHRHWSIALTEATKFA